MVAIAEQLFFFDLCQIVIVVFLLQLMEVGALGVSGRTVVVRDAHRLAKNVLAAAAIRHHLTVVHRVVDLTYKKHQIVRRVQVNG